VKIAKRHGAKLLINSRVKNIDYKSGGKVKVNTEQGASHTFDLLIGSDGVNSVVRRSLFPDIKPAPPTTNCAYRAIVPYEQIQKDPVAKELIEKFTMEVWMSDKSYIISYPITAGKDFNLVLSHHTDKLVDSVQEIDMKDLRKQYENYDPRIKRIIDMIPEAQRWPACLLSAL
jgi:salicylate hydroxylase